MRTMMVAPVIREGTSIGAIMIRRKEVVRLLISKSKLLETFADQAVIAIENVRLFKNSARRWSSKRRRAKSWA